MNTNDEDILGLFSKGSAPDTKFTKPTGPTKAPGAMFTLSYGTEQLSRPWRPGLTVAQAYKEVSAELSFDSSRAVAYRARGAIIQPTTDVEPGVTYQANATHEMKG